MSNGFPLGDIIFFAVIAIFIFMKLRNQLGKTNEEEDQKRRDSIKRFLKEKADKKSTILEGKGKVIDVTEKLAQKKAEEQIEESKQKNIGNKYIQELNEKNQKELSETLSKMKTDINSFIIGARKAFEIIIEAFSKEDKKTLQSLLSAKAYGDFEREIEKRKKDGKKLETTLISILSSSIKSIKITTRTIQIVVNFVTEQINIIKDKDDKIIDGSSKTINTVSDTWTFKKDIKSKDPNWTIVATG